MIQRAQRACSARQRVGQVQQKNCRSPFQAIRTCANILLFTATLAPFAPHFTFALTLVRSLSPHVLCFRPHSRATFVSHVPAFAVYLDCFFALYLLSHLASLPFAPLEIPLPTFTLMLIRCAVHKM